jgi:CubicO group peptidase (beta-lactamase class C family)
MRKLLLLPVVFFISFAIFTIASCNPTDTENNKPLFQPKTRTARLSQILNKTENLRYLKSLAIWQNGELIVERYINGGTSDQLHDIRSASKSILSAILGIALKDGYIKSLDQKPIDFFPEYITDDLDPKIYDLTIRHLITMKSGFKIVESAKIYAQLYASSDWVDHIIHLPFGEQPGKKFNYHSFNTHLLSATLTKAIGMSTLEYARSALFEPLGITNVKWNQDPKGYHIGGWGLYLNARDMLKFGMLYLNRGVFDGISIIPEKWIEWSTSPSTGVMGTYYSGRNQSYCYGFLWWIKRVGETIDIPFAMGHGGQRIAFIPEVNAVLVTQAEPNPKPSLSFKRHRAVDSLLFDDVVDYLSRR